MMLQKEYVVEDGQVFYRKKPLYKQPLFWTTIVGAVTSVILLVVSIVVMIALGASDFSTFDTEIYNDYGSYADKYTSVEDYTPYEIGETAKIEGFEVTVTSIEKDDSLVLEDDSLNQAVVVKATIKNTSDSDYYFSEYNFNLYDSEEQSAYLDLKTYDVNTPEKIKAGETVDIYLVYGASADTSYIVTYGENSWSEYFSNHI